jgi:hypothetical protein
MANKETSKSGKKELRQDVLVENLIPNPGKQLPTVQLSGWLGKGEEEGTWNLYLSPTLNEYVQFSGNDVVHSQPLTAETAPLGGTSVWFKTDAPLKYVRVTTRQMQAGFLSGSITSRNLSSATASLPGAIVRIATIFANSIGARRLICGAHQTNDGVFCGSSDVDACATIDNCAYSGPGGACASQIQEGPLC